MVHGSDVLHHGVITFGDDQEADISEVGKAGGIIEKKWTWTAEEF